MDNERDHCDIRSGSKSCISEDMDMTSHVHEEDVTSVRFCNKIGDPSNGSFVNHANDSLKYDLSADHAEPKYRFQNRHRRQGSFLSISKKDYKMMAQGKPIHYYDVRSGSYLVVKAVKHPKEKTTSKISVSLKESRRDQEEVHDGVCSKKEDYCSEVGSTVTSGIDSSSEEEGTFSSTKDDFSTNPITSATSRLRVPSTTEISTRRKSLKTGRRSNTIH
uniref:Uncharacterized protein n=1 Tax=Chenopodium quinoa TaxID=63459 RepID=A0A803N606_CHEQI